MNVTSAASLEFVSHGLAITRVRRNHSPSALFAHVKDASIEENGALVACSGVKAVCSLKDKRVVNVPLEILIRCKSWSGKSAFASTAKRLAWLSAKDCEIHAAGATANAASTASP